MVKRCPNTWGKYGSYVIWSIATQEVLTMRSAMRAASQLFGRGPTDVVVAPVPAR